MKCQICGKEQNYQTGQCITQKKRTIKVKQFFSKERISNGMLIPFHYVHNVGQDWRVHSFVAENLFIGTFTYIAVQTDRYGIFVFISEISASWIYATQLRSSTRNNLFKTNDESRTSQYELIVLYCVMLERNNRAVPVCNDHINDRIPKT